MGTGGKRDEASIRGIFIASMGGFSHDGRHRITGTFTSAMQPLHALSSSRLRWKVRLMRGLKASVGIPMRDGGIIN